MADDSNQTSDLKSGRGGKYYPNIKRSGRFYTNTRRRGYVLP